MGVALKKQIAELAAAQAKTIDVIAALKSGQPTNRFQGPIGAGITGGEPIALKGDAMKGVRFARAMRCLAAAKTFGVDPMTVADHFNKGMNLGDSLKKVIAGYTVKALGEATAAAGGVFAPDEFSAEWIDYLYPQLALVKAGVRTIPMGGQSKSIPRLSGAVSVSWGTEGSQSTYSQPTFDGVQLTLKDVKILLAMNNDWLRDQAVATDVIVRDHITEMALLAIDLAGIRGLGSAYQPRGLRYWAPSATNVLQSAAGTGAPSLQSAADDLELGSGVLDGFNTPKSKRAMICHPRTVSGMKTLRDGVGRFPIAEEFNAHKTIFGLPVFETTQIPTNLAGGGSGTSAESEIYNFEATEVEMGLGLSPSVEISREASYHDASSNQQNAFENDQTVMRLIARTDWIMRHNTSVVVTTGCTYGVA